MQITQDLFCKDLLLSVWMCNRLCAYVQRRRYSLSRASKAHQGQSRGVSRQETAKSELETLFVNQVATIIVEDS